MGSHSQPEDQKTRTAVLERLNRAVVPLSARDISRSVRIPLPDVSSCLLSLQRDGIVGVSKRRWQLRDGAKGQILERPTAKVRTLPVDSIATKSQRHVPTTPIQSPRLTTAPDTSPPETAASTSRQRTKRGSRWQAFRNLCQYYAECVRLDQGTTIHGKADQENERFVCLGGNLDWRESDEPPEMQIAIPRGWAEFIKQAKKGSHLFLGAPLNRFKWRDTSSGNRIDFISPVFIAPVSLDIAQTTLRLSLLGPIRVNDGWLEKRLPDGEERRIFLELCGVDLDESDVSKATLHYRSFAPFCDLLNHYYHNWCVEPLDIRSLRTSPDLANAKHDGIYNRAALFTPGRWRYTARLHEELLELAWEVTDEELDRSSLALVFPHKARLFGQAQQLVTKPYEAYFPNALESEDKSESVNIMLRSVVHLAGVEPLNEEQLSACQSAIHNHLTVIVGPPGTGKSRVVSSVLTQAAIAGHSALFASKNHQALEAVVPRLNAAVEPAQVILRLARPFGSSPDTSLQQTLADLLGRPPSEQSIARRDQLRERVAYALSSLQQHRDTLRQTQELHAQLGDAEHLLREIQTGLPLAVGERLASAPKLPLSAEIAAVLKKLQPLPPFQMSVSWAWQAFTALFSRRNTIVTAHHIHRSYHAHFESKPADCDPSGDLPAIGPNDLLSHLRRWYQYARGIEANRRVRDLRAEVTQADSLETLYQQYRDVLDSAVQLSRDCLRAVADAWGAELTPDERRNLVDLWSGIQNYQTVGGEFAEGNLGRLLERSFPVLLQHVPLVATTNLSVGRHLPLRAGDIELLIIDEASQCDIASVVPLLFRCRRAVFVGDPREPDMTCRM